MFLQMKHYQLFLTAALFLLGKTVASAQPYDFQNTKLKDDKRVELFLKHLTLEEKMQWMAPMLGSQRLGIPITSCYEGLHGLALGGPSRNNGVKTANSNEDGRDSTSSNFDERLFREYYAYPFYKGITEGGSRAFMASYNCWNGIPMAVHPCLNEITRNEWGNNGIICTDGGAYAMLVNAHAFIPETGRILFSIGASSADIRTSVSK